MLLLETELEKFLKYVIDVHTNEYGLLNVCENGDELDPTIERVVKMYIDEKNKRGYKTLNNSDRPWKK
jgi:hypothetical protein